MWAFEAVQFLNVVAVADNSLNAVPVHKTQ
jgi:hypothetical protein